MKTEASHKRNRHTLSFLRAGLFFVLVIEMFGIASELYLLDHFEGGWQQLPMYVLAATLLCMLLLVTVRIRPLVWLVSLAMLCCIATGALGSYLHFQGNMEFDLEFDPDLEGMELFWKAMDKNPPPLVPAAFVQLGLLGLVYTFRHPVSEKSRFQNQGESS